MSQPALNANKASAMLNTLGQIKVNDFFSYDLQSNAPNIVNCNIVALNPRSIPAAANVPGSDISFKLPRNGLLMDACFRVTCKGAVNTDSGLNMVGARLFREVAVKAQSKNIHAYSDSYVQSRLATDSLERSGNIIPGLKGSTTVNTTDSTVFVIPFYSSFLDSTNTFLDLSFIEELSVDVKMNQLAAMGLSGAFTEFDIKMYVRYIDMDAETKDAYLANNFKSPQLTMLVSDVYTETDQTITASASSVIVPMKCPYVVKRTFVFLEDSTLSVGPSADQSITTLSTRFSGNLAFDSVPADVMKYLGVRDGCSNIDVDGAIGDVDVGIRGNSTTSENVYVINWGLSDSTITNSGAISFGNINNPELTIGVTPHTDADRVVKTCHEILKLVTIDSANGYVSSSYAT